MAEVQFVPCKGWPNVAGGISTMTLRAIR